MKSVIDRRTNSTAKSNSPSSKFLAEFEPKKQLISARSIRPNPTVRVPISKEKGQFQDSEKVCNTTAHLQGLNEVSSECLTKKANRTKPSTIGLTLTSPDGKVKDLLGTKKQPILHTSSTTSNWLTNSELWLPKIAIRSFASKDIENHSLSEEKVDAQKVGKESEVVSRVKIGDQHFLEFNEALKLCGTELEGGQGLIRTFKLIDGSWVAVLNDFVLRCGPEIGFWEKVPVRDIKCIMVDPGYLLVCFVPAKCCGTEALTNSWEFFIGEPSKTESLISSVLFASSRLEMNSHPSKSGLDGDEGDQIQLISLRTLAELPLLNRIIKSINKAQDVVLYSAMAHAETVESETCINDDIMMQLESGKYQPVNLHLMGACLKITPTYTTKYHNQAILEINISEISLLSRREEPRPHTLHILWRSQSINLSGSNCSTISELFGRLRKRNATEKDLSRTPVYVVLTEYFLNLYSTRNQNDLLLQVPVLNLIVGKPNPSSLLIMSGIMEADESICNAINSCCWKLTFFTNEDCEKLHDILQARIPEL